jgi:DDE superfamily endonuclease
MRAVQTLCGEYAEDNIYNMDETGLFWRRGPNSGLSSEPKAGVKKDKSRITLTVCTNMTGAHRLPLWAIGTAKKPRALKGVNLEALGLRWSANKKAWMNTIVMVDWLKLFYASIEPSRSVLLLMDNFSAHIAGVEIAAPPPNMRIQWLPPNATSLYQPLDQGIISNLKTHYRKQWLQFMIQEYEIQRNPLDTITLYHSIEWLTRMWASDVNN